MKALLYKDLLVLWVQNKMYLILLVAMGALGAVSRTSMTHSYCLLITSTLVLNMLQTDETSHWLTYTDTTPISRKQVVMEKYLLNLLILVGTVVCLLVFRVIAGFVYHDMDGILKEYFYGCSISFSAMLVMTTFSFPIVFRFGVSHGRLIYLVLVGVIAAVVTIGNTSASVGFMVHLWDEKLARGMVFTVLCLILYVVSYKVSVQWYKERELA